MIRVNLVHLKDVSGPARRDSRRSSLREREALASPILLVQRVDGCHTVTECKHKESKTLGHKQLTYPLSQQVRGTMTLTQGVYGEGYHGSIPAGPLEALRPHGPQTTISMTELPHISFSNFYEAMTTGIPNTKSAVYVRQHQLRNEVYTWSKRQIYSQGLAIRR